MDVTVKNIVGNTNYTLNIDSQINRAAILPSAQLHSASIYQNDNQEAMNNASITQSQKQGATTTQGLHNSQRKATCQDVQLMLEKNEATLRLWSYLHNQQPPKHNIQEHKIWLQKCTAYRQQVGTRLEVLASLADKQIAMEDADDKSKSTSPRETPSLNSINSQPNIAANTSRQVHQHQTQLKIQEETGASQSASSEAVSDPKLEPSVSFPTGMPMKQSVVTSNTIFYPNAPSSSAMVFPVTSAPTSSTSSSYLTQSNNYNVGGGVNSAMMNAQMMAMGMPPTMAMSQPGAMYNTAQFDPNTFSAVEGPSNCGNSGAQLPTDPFNASFQNPALTMQGYNVGTSQMMSRASFNPLQNAQMMMTAMNYGLQQQQQYQANMMVAQQQQQQPLAKGHTTSTQQVQHTAPGQPQKPAQAHSTSFSAQDVEMFDALANSDFLK